MNELNVLIITGRKNDFSIAIRASTAITWWWPESSDTVRDMWRDYSAVFLEKGVRRGKLFAPTALCNKVTPVEFSRPEKVEGVIRAILGLSVVEKPQADGHGWAPFAAAKPATASSVQAGELSLSEFVAQNANVPVGTKQLAYGVAAAEIDRLWALRRAQTGQEPAKATVRRYYYLLPRNKAAQGSG